MKMYVVRLDLKLALESGMRTSSVSKFYGREKEGVGSRASDEGHRERGGTYRCSKFRLWRV